MKKPILFALLFSSFQSIAQYDVTNIQPLKRPNCPLKQEKTSDTITTYLDRATAFQNLNAGAAGFVLGTSNILAETAVHYSDLGNLRVTEAWIYFSYKNIVNTADQFDVKVYSATSDSMPNNVLTSASISSSSMDVNGFPTIVTFPSYTPQSGQFLIGIDHNSANVDDTISLISTNADMANGGPDGALEKRVRQKTNSGTWMRAYDIWTITGNPYDADALIIPIVDFQSAEVQDLGDFKLLSAYPCPANDAVNLDFELTETATLTVKIMDARGVLIHEEIITGTGTKNINFPTNNLSNGHYYYILQSDRTVLGSAFQVQH